MSATGQLLNELSDTLAAAGHQVTVLTSRQDYNNPHADYPAHETVNGVLVHRCWSATFGRGRLLGRAADYLTFYATVFLALLRIVRAGDIVVTTTDPPLLGVAMAPAIKLKRAHQVNWLHDLFPEIATRSGMHVLGGVFGRLIQAARDRNCRRVGANVVLGERMHDYLAARAIAQDKLHIIPNWASQHLSAVAADQNTLRSRWLLDRKFVIGYAGNLGRVHEFDTLLSAARRLAQEDQFVFLVVGAGIHWQALRTRVAELGLRNVVFQPYQPRGQLAASLCAADLHLVSLRPEFEALVVPSKIYSIAAVGRPAVFIGDADGEVARLLDKYEFGYSVAVGDADRLAQLIREVAANEALYTQLCAHAARAHRENFMPSAALARWTRLLRAL